MDHPSKGRQGTRDDEDDDFDALGAMEQQELARELRAGAEADIARAKVQNYPGLFHDCSISRASVKSEGTGARSCSRPSSDNIFPTQSMLPEGLLRLVRREVRRALKVETAGILHSLELRIKDSISSSQSDCTDGLLRALQHERGRWRTGDLMGMLPVGSKPGKHTGVHLDPEFASCMIAPPHRDLDSVISSQLHEVLEQCTELAEECSWQDEEPETAAPRFGCDHAIGQRLENLLRRTASTVELESRARQESELWLLSCIQEARKDFQGVLASVRNSTLEHQKENTETGQTLMSCSSLSEDEICSPVSATSTSSQISAILGSGSLQLSRDSQPDREEDQERQVNLHVAARGPCKAFKKS